MVSKIVPYQLERGLWVKVALDFHLSTAESVKKTVLFKVINHVNFEFFKLF